MIRPSTIATWTLMSVIVLSACSKTEEKPQDAKAEAPEAKKGEKKKNKLKKAKGKSGAAKASNMAPDMPETELGDIPTAEDLEEEAHKTIALENLESELDRLEAEIAGPAT